MTEYSRDTAGAYLCALQALMPALSGVDIDRFADALGRVGICIEGGRT